MAWSALDGASAAQAPRSKVLAKLDIVAPQACGAAYTAAPAATAAAAAADVRRRLWCPRRWGGGWTRACLRYGSAALPGAVPARVRASASRWPKSHVFRREAPH